MGDANWIFIYSLLIVALGYLLKRLGILRENDGATLSKIILNVTLPAVVLRTVTKIALTPTLLLLPALSVVYTAFIIVVGLTVFRRSENRAKGLSLMSIIGFNTGLFAFPIVHAVWGQVGLQYIAIFDLANSFMFFGVNYMIADYYSKRDDPNRRPVSVTYILANLVRSVPLLSYIVALALALASVQLPDFLNGLLDIPARANSLLVLLLLGVYFRPTIDRSHAAQMAKLLLIRYGIGAAVGLLLYLLLPLPHLVRVIMATALILPVGLTVVPFSAEFRLDYRFASVMVNVTMVVSFACMWIYANIL